MLKLELNSEPGGIKVRWHDGLGLTFHRRDGSIILHVNATYADERALMTAAHALNFMFKSIKNGPKPASPSTSSTNPHDHQGDGRET